MATEKKPRLRKPRIEYSWAWQRAADAPGGYDYRVNWALLGGNGEHVCGSNQGARDKYDAYRSVQNASILLGGNLSVRLALGDIREVGPGKKPQDR